MKHLWKQVAALLVACLIFNLLPTSAFAATVARPNAPTDLNAVSISAKQINLTWSAVPGAKSYLVYRSAGSSRSFKKIATVSKPYYKSTGLKAITQYNYKVVACNSGGKSDFSAVASACTAPVAPAGVKATRVNDGKIKITWKAVSGARGYIVYASRNNGAFAPLASLGASSRSYTHAGFAPGGYRYQVATIGFNGQEARSAKTRSISVKGVALGAPAGIEATKVSDTQIQVRWNAAAGATGYHVYCDSGSGWVCLSTTGSTTFDHSGLPAGSYTYVVAAICDDREGPWGAATVAVTLEAPPPPPAPEPSTPPSPPSSDPTTPPSPPTTTPTSPPTTPPQTQLLPAPGNFSAATYNYQSVQLTYDVVQNAATYRIYYATVASSNVGDYQFFDWASKDCRVVGLNAGTKYYFRVAAVDAQGQAGTPTGFLAATTAPAPLPVPQPKFKLYTSTYGAFDVVGGKYRMNFVRDTSPIYPTVNEPSFNFYVGASSNNMTYDCSADLSQYFYYDVTPGQALWYGFTANYGPYASTMQKLQFAALQKPIGVVTAPITSTVKLSWNAVDAAGGYNLYVCVGAPDTTIPWAEFKASATTNGHFVCTAYTSGTSYTFTGMPNYSSYYYIVVPTKAGVEGWYCGFMKGNVFY